MGAELARREWVGVALRMKDQRRRAPKAPFLLLMIVREIRKLESLNRRAEHRMAYHLTCILPLSSSKALKFPPTRRPRTLWKLVAGPAVTVRVEQAASTILLHWEKETLLATLIQAGFQAFRAEVMQG